MRKATVKNMLQENYEDILNYKQQGMLNDEIGEIYGVSKSSITRLFQANGIFSRNLMDKEVCTPLIIDDYQSGMTMTEIAEKYHTSHETTSLILKENNINIRPAYKTIYTLNEHYFDIIDTPEKAYILGMLAADGCVCKYNITISLQENDKDILEKINICVGSNRPLSYIDKQSKGLRDKNAYVLNITNKHMANTLKDIGIIENKSLKLEFPEVITDELLPHFFRGLWDGDGFIEKKRFRTGCTGTKMLLFEVMNKIKRILGIEFHAHEEHNHNGITYTIKVSNQKDCMIFLNYIYNDATIYLQRKYDIYQTYINKSCAA